MSKTIDPTGKMDRRGALQVLAGTVSLPVLSERALGHHATPVNQRSENAANPKFFNREELQMLDVLSEIIIPADDHSPGAHAAQVAEFMDELISQSSEKTKQIWRRGLAKIEGLANARYRRSFLACSPTQQTAFLHLISQNEESPQSLEEKFFVALKRATVDGYYRSAIGIHNDLQYQGNKYLTAFPGCTQSPAG